MSLLQSLDDFIDFWTVNFQLKTLHLTMQLSFDLLQLKISPVNVWHVLGRLNEDYNALSVCEKVKQLLYLQLFLTN